MTNELSIVSNSHNTSFVWKNTSGFTRIRFIKSQSFYIWERNIWYAKEHYMNYTSTNSMLLISPGNTIYAIEFRSYNQNNVTYRSKQIPSYCYFNRKMFYPLNTIHICTYISYLINFLQQKNRPRSRLTEAPSSLPLLSLASFPLGFYISLKMKCVWKNIDRLSLCHE